MNRKDKESRQERVSYIGERGSVVILQNEVEMQILFTPLQLPAHHPPRSGSPKICLLAISRSGPGNPAPKQFMIYASFIFKFD